MSSSYPMEKTQPGGHQGPYNSYPHVTQPQEPDNPYPYVTQQQGPYNPHPHVTQPQGPYNPYPHVTQPQGPYNPHPHVTQPISQTNTTVIIQQPAAAAGIRDWSTGICDCCKDMEVCLCSIFCGICLAMRVSSDMDETMCLPCCVPNYLMALRVKMRTQERIQGTICNDCLIEMCCGTCALCQLAREVKMVKQRRQL